jgi:hypothetical protein
MVVIAQFGRVIVSGLPWVSRWIVVVRLSTSFCTVTRPIVSVSNVVVWPRTGETGRLELTTDARIK